MEYAVFWLLIVWGQGGAGSALTSQTIPYPTVQACEQAKATIVKGDQNGGLTRPTADIAHIYCIPGQ